MQQSPAILDSCFTRNSGSEIALCRYVNVLEKNLFRPVENEKRAFSNSSGLKSFFEKLRVRDGLVWMVGLTVCM